MQQVDPALDETFRKMLARAPRGPWWMEGGGGEDGRRGRWIASIWVAGVFIRARRFRSKSNARRWLRQHTQDDPEIYRGRLTRMDRKRWRVRRWNPWEDATKAFYLPCLCLCREPQEQEQEQLDVP
jgi:hypothetical protein